MKKSPISDIIVMKGLKKSMLKLKDDGTLNILASLDRELFIKITGMPYIMKSSSSTWKNPDKMLYLKSREG